MPGFAKASSLMVKEVRVRFSGGLRLAPKVR